MLRINEKLDYCPTQRWDDPGPNVPLSPANTWKCGKRNCRGGPSPAPSPEPTATCARALSRGHISRILVTVLRAGDEERQDHDGRIRLRIITVYLWTFSPATNSWLKKYFSFFTLEKFDYLWLFNFEQIPYNLYMINYFCLGKEFILQNGPSLGGA